MFWKFPERQQEVGWARPLLEKAAAGEGLFCHVPPGQSCWVPDTEAWGSLTVGRRYWYMLHWWQCSGMGQHFKYAMIFKPEISFLENFLRKIHIYVPKEYKDIHYSNDGIMIYACNRYTTVEKKMCTVI